MYNNVTQAANCLAPADIPLPNNWSAYEMDDGRKVFVDHANKITTWTDPRDSLTKPQTFSDCIGDELPYGWEIGHDPVIGEYFIDHNTGNNQLEDPREQWRNIQESMIQYYLQSAKKSVETKENIVKLKQERFSLADQELANLLSMLQKFNEKHHPQSVSSSSQSNLGSKNSLASASSSCSLCSKFDPDILKAEIETARQRLTKLKLEEQHARQDLVQKQKGFETLNKLKANINRRPSGYSLNERNALEYELSDLKKLLTEIEKEKSSLLNQVSDLWQCLQNGAGKLESRPDLSADKASCSSQTDVADLTASGSRVAALARARLRYNELKCLLYSSHQQLAALNEKMLPADLELNHDQLILIQEKEQLLRELKSVCYESAPVQLRNTSQTLINSGSPEPYTDPRQKLTVKMHELEEDLRRALRLTREEMIERSLILKKKEDLEERIHETGMSLANLEQQLKSLSASTLSTSSLDTASNSASCTSLSAFPESRVARRATFKMYDDVRKRVEQLVGGNFSRSTSFVDSGEKTASTSSFALASSSDLIVHRENSVGSTGTDAGNKSMSAAVSDESVAGDSGVFDGVSKRCASGHNVNTASVTIPSPTVAQIMVTLNFDADTSKFYVTLEKARNLSCLWSGSASAAPSGSGACPLDVNGCVESCAPSRPKSVQIRGSLLPYATGEDFNFKTDWLSDLGARDGSNDRIVFKKTFQFNITLKAICSKILQIYVFAQRYGTADCLGEAQINLAEFNCQMMRSQWINVLDCQLLALPRSECLVALPEERPKSGSGNVASPIDNEQALKRRSGSTASSRRLNTLKEESSDESTIIPSQTSTLTRNIETCLIEESLCGESGKRRMPAFIGEPCKSDFCCLRLTVNESDSSDNEINESKKFVAPLFQRLQSCSNVRTSQTSEKETNTDTMSPLSATEKSFGDNSFSSRQKNDVSSPSAVVARKLLSRSGSDTSVALYKREPFKRNVVERRSLRWKKPLSASCWQNVFRSSRQHSSKGGGRDIPLIKGSSKDNQYRTSVDVDIDLQTMKLRLERQKEDVDALQIIKARLERRQKEDDEAQLTSDLPDRVNRVLLTDCDSLKNISSVICNDSEYTVNCSYFISPRKNLSKERQARHFIRKAARKVQKLNETKVQRPSVSDFCSKISALINTPDSLISTIKLMDGDG